VEVTVEAYRLDKVEVYVEVIVLFI
jgi:hypothetical protein